MNNGCANFRFSHESWRFFILISSGYAVKFKYNFKIFKIFKLKNLKLELILVNSK